MGRHMNTVEQTEIWDRYEAGQTLREIAASVGRPLSTVRDYVQMVDALDVSRVVEYAILLDNATTCAKVGYFLERYREFWPFDDPVLDPLRDRKPRQPQHMDRREGGSLVRDWNLIVPHAVAEETWDQFYGYRW